MSRRRRWLAVIALLVLVVPLVGIYWLLASGSGRDWTLARVIGQLPPGTLQIGSSEGQLRGPLTLRDVRYRGDGFSLSVDQLTLDHALQSLFGKRIDIHALHVEGMRVELDAAPPSDEPTRIELPDQLPWPTVSLPVAISVAELSIGTLEVVQNSQVLLPASAIRATDVALSEDRLRLGALSMLNVQGQLGLRGEIGLAGDVAAGLEAEWTLPGEQTPAAQLRVDGANNTLAALLELAGQGTVQLQLERDWRWSLTADLPTFELQRWLPAEPADDKGEGEREGDDASASSPEAAPDVLAISIAARGDARHFEMSGQVATDARSLLIEQGRFELVDAGQSLRLIDVRLVPDSGGRASVSGTVDFAEVLQLDLVAQLEQLGVPAGEDSDQALLDGQLAVRGPLAALHIELLEGRITRGDLDAAVELAGELQEAGFRLDSLALRTTGGELTASGQVGWQPALNGELTANLRNFDPSLLLAELPGRISGTLTVSGSQDPQSPQLHVALDGLQGELRQRPLSGSGVLDWRDDKAQANLDVRLGVSHLRVDGNPGETLDLTVRLTPLALEDVLPGTGGLMNADLRVRGQRDAPRISGDVTGTALRIEGWSIAALAMEVDGRIDGVGAGSFSLEATGIENGATVIDSANLRLRGDRAQHALDLALASERADVELAVTGGLVGETWSGRLQSLEIKPGERERWQLDAPADLAWRAGQFSVERTCLRAPPSRQLCVEADGSGAQQTVSARMIGVELQALVLAAGVDGLQIDGLVEGELDLERRGGAPLTGSLAVRLPQGTLTQADVDDRPLLRWEAVELAATLDAASLTASLSGRLDETGSISGRFSGGSPMADADATMEGSVQLDLPSVGALELAVQDLANVRGTLRAGLQFSGPWRAPQVAGDVALEALGAELPALGIRLRDSGIVLRGDGDRFDIEGELDTGAGKLRLTGSLNDALGATPSADLRIRGEGVRVADMPQARAIVSPDLRLRYRNGGLVLTGKVIVPEAAIALDQLEGAVGTSPDVVILDPREGDQRGTALPLQARIEVELGSKVTLVGFGFDGGISGTLSINERSGRATTGRGTLTVRGRYEAYGQDLEILRGRLLFANSPLDDPGVDVRAQREVDDVTVGIEVSGSALRPQLAVWSSPALDQAEALSYLVLGRPLRSASAADGDELGQAAAAIGGNLLAGRVGTRLGFDTFEVADSQALGGAAFTVGKFLSPALYLSYGVSLFGSGQVVTLRYLLSEQFDIEIESGSESRAGFNYRIER